jgi:hypothetical protein
MANINNDFSDYNKFYIVSNGIAPLEVKDLIGWEEYGLDGARNLDYHGTLESVSKKVSFKGEPKRYIEDVYNNTGILADLRLIRLKLKTVNNEVVWVQLDPVYADFETYGIKDNLLSLNFYSNSLMEIINAHEDDEFEIETLETINNQTIDELEQNYVTLKGRSMITSGESITVPRSRNGGFWSYSTNNVSGLVVQSLITKLISEGPSRHSASIERLVVRNPEDVSSSGFIYDATTSDLNPNTSVKVKVKANQLSIFSSVVCRLSLLKYKKRDGLAEYDLIEEKVLYESTPIAGYFGITYWSYNNLPIPIPLTGNVFEVTFDDVAWDEGIMLGVLKDDATSVVDYKVEDTKILLSEVEYYEQSTSRFLFYHDVINRLMYILTGSKDKFISNVLGRKELDYDEDGEAGLVGFLSGMWVRQFTKDNKNYKSPKISLKDSLTSISNAFNLGSGVETIDNVEKLVLEKLEYFYRDDIAGKFPQQINNEEFSVDSKSFYSRLDFGYKKSGGVDQEMGLDEPNVKSQFITPVITTGKFDKLIEVRADEYKQEELRRNPSNLYPDEQINGDENNWFIDLKRNADPTIQFEQLHWSDVLDTEPTGIHDPDSFASMRFTPATILRRFANNFKSGLYLYTEKFINFISGSPNVELYMKFTDESIGYKENDNVKIGDLKNPIFKNEIIKFTHPWSDEVEELIFGKTEVTINGQKRLVPNFYFKMEFENNKGEIVRGYYLKHEFSDNPTFEFQIANEEII